MQLPIDPAEKFADNWAYLRTELNWLDRVLMLAVARHRKDTKDIDRIAQSRADRVTSHWWKGVISLEADIAHDEHRKPSPTSAIAKLSYQQQLETRIRASRQQNIVLGLPLLCDRLKLTVFEKNLILMSLAPEVNRRYARLYRYLQAEDLLLKTDLPTVDLALRLLCRNDQEWRTARDRLAASSPLLHHSLLKLLPATADTLLNQFLKLDNSLINYLLADQPSAQCLESLLKVPVSSASLLTYRQVPIDWSALVLPPSLLAALQHLVWRTQHYSSVNRLWDWQPSTTTTFQSGAIVLMAGAAGTGKTLAAAALAHVLNTPLVCVDLAQLTAETSAQVLQDIAAQAPKVLLLQSAHCWLGRSAQLPESAIAQLFDQRRSLPGLTLLETRVNHAIRLHWRRQCQPQLTFPLPQASDRLALWHQAFPSQISLSPNLDWNLLAQIPLTGGQIQAIAYEATLYLAASSEPQLSIAHLKQALAQHGKSLPHAARLQARD